jgi:hypothetical protein
MADLVHPAMGEQNKNKGNQPEAVFCWPAPRPLPVVKNRSVTLRTMRLMVIVFFIVMLIVLDQTRFRGYYLEQVARAIAWAIY